ncbi:MAG TPA: transposase family protein [Actinoplanes sp.]
MHLRTTDEQAWCWPQCGTRTSRSKGRWTTRPRDLPGTGRRPQLVWVKRRWRCDADVGYAAAPSGQADCPTSVCETTTCRQSGRR